MVALMSESDPEKVDVMALAEQVRELSGNCEQHVRDALGLPLDGTIETLPILDHYIRISQPAVRERPELLPLLSRTIGAYFGQVVADHFGGFWYLPSSDVQTWYVCLRAVYLAFNPIGMAHAALSWGLERDATFDPPSELHLQKRDREVIEQRLDALPPVREQDFFALSTRVEALEIAVAVLGEQRAARGDAETALSDDDYAPALEEQTGQPPLGAGWN